MRRAVALVQAQQLTTSHITITICPRHRNPASHWAFLAPAPPLLLAAAAVVVVVWPYHRNDPQPLVTEPRHHQGCPLTAIIIIMVQEALAAVAYLPV